MFGTMTNGSTWAAPAPTPAPASPRAPGERSDQERHLATIVRRALRVGLGPPELVRWVRTTAANLSADGVEDGEPLTRGVAQALGQALRRPATATWAGGPET